MPKHLLNQKFHTELWQKLTPLRYFLKLISKQVCKCFCMSAMFRVSPRDKVWVQVFVIYGYFIWSTYILIWYHDLRGNMYYCLE